MFGVAIWLHDEVKEGLDFYEVVLSECFPELGPGFGQCELKPLVKYILAFPSLRHLN